jgi:hypothetical protein
LTGRTGLTWVTALTVASLLLGGGALNALAEERGGGHRGGGGQGNSGHQQQQQQQEKPAVGHKDDDKPQTTANPTTKHEDDHDVGRKRNLDDNKDKDDLVTKPDRVTDDVRPGNHCDGECNDHDDGDDMTTSVVDDRDDN